MRVLAVDPGYERLGLAVIEKETGGKETLLFSECFKTSAKLAHAGRLHLIGEELGRLILEYTPEAVAIETLFFSNNQKTAMQVSEARGTLLYVAASAGIPVSEFSPADIKIAVTSYGKSDKAQVTEMVKRLIHIEKPIQYDDEYDAIAIGLTFFATHR